MTRKNLATVKTDITEVDHGFANVMRALMGLDELYADAGIFGKNGSAEVKKAAANELGAELKFPNGRIVKIPERSFIRSTADERGDKWQDLAERGLNAIIEGRTTPEVVIEAIGQRMESDIKRKIRMGPFRKNRPSTLKKKAPRTKPLIDTSRMINSVTHETGKIR